MLVTSRCTTIVAGLVWLGFLAGACPRLLTAAHPVPDQAALREAEQLIGQVFGEEVKLARFAPEKKALAEKLMESSSTVTEGPAVEFVLLKMAQVQATAARDYATVLKANEELERRFDYDGAESTSEALAAISRSLRGTVERKGMVLRAIPLVQQCFAQDRIASALKYSTFCQAAGRLCGDPAIAQRTAAMHDQLQAIESELPAVQQALEALRDSPDLGSQNLTIGRYHCFTRGSWETGLPYLAKCDDPVLRSLAERDLAGGGGGDGWTAQGDGWWDYAEMQPPAIRNACRRRAAYWYTEAAATLSGLMKDRVEKRVQQVQKSAPPALVAKPVDLQGLETEAILVIAGNREPSRERDKQRLISDDLNNQPVDVLGRAEWVVGGRAGGAIRFTAADPKSPPAEQSRLMLGHRVAGFPLEDFTLALWCQVEAHEGALIGSGQKELWQREWFLSSQQFYWRPKAGSGSGARDSVTHVLSFEPAPLQVWQHLAVVRQGTQATVYIDGRPATSSNEFSSEPLPIYGNGLMVGNSLGNSGRFEKWRPYGGLVDEVGLWARALTEAEVDRLYRAGRARQSLAD